MSDSTEKYFVFYNRIANSNYIFPDGSQANFTGGRYATQDEDKAAHLNSVVKQGNPHIFIDPAKLMLTVDELDPMAELKARIIAEYEAKQALVRGEMGTSVQGKLNVADTLSIGEGAADSTSGATAPLAGIKIGSSK